MQARSCREPRSIHAETSHRTKENEDVAETGVAAQELKQFVERVERLEEEKKAIADDIRDVFAEMKGRGFDTKAVRQIIRIRKQDHAERQGNGSDPRTLYVRLEHDLRRKGRTISVVSCFGTQFWPLSTKD